MPDAQRLYRKPERGPPLPQFWGNRKCRNDLLALPWLPKLVAGGLLDAFYTVSKVIVSESGEWSEEDIRDLTAFALQYAVTLDPETDEDSEGQST